MLQALIVQQHTLCKISRVSSPFNVTHGFVKNACNDSLILVCRRNFAILSCSGLFRLLDASLCEQSSSGMTAPIKRLYLIFMYLNAEEN